MTEAAQRDPGRPCRHAKPRGTVTAAPAEIPLSLPRSARSDMDGALGLTPTSNRTALGPDRAGNRYDATDMSERVRLAELLAALSLATDLGLGQPMEYLLRTCALSLRLADALGLDAATRGDVYYLALLRWIGCTSH